MKKLISIVMIITLMLSMVLNVNAKNDKNEKKKEEEVVIETIGEDYFPEFEDINEVGETLKANVKDKSDGLITARYVVPGIPEQNTLSIWHYYQDGQYYSSDEMETTNQSIGSVG